MKQDFFNTVLELVEEGRVHERCRDVERIDLITSEGSMHAVPCGQRDA